MTPRIGNPTAKPPGIKYAGEQSSESAGYRKGRTAQKVIIGAFLDSERFKALREKRIYENGLQQAQQSQPNLALFAHAFLSTSHTIDALPATPYARTTPFLLLFLLPHVRAQS